MKTCMLMAAMALYVGCNVTAPPGDAGADAGVDASVVIDQAKAPDMLTVDIAELPADMKDPVDMTQLYVVTCPMIFMCCSENLLWKIAWADSCRALNSCPSIITYGQQCSAAGWTSAMYTCDPC